MPGILIKGDGVAACCCELLLRRAGFDVSAESAPRRRLPVIMLNESAIALMRDVFEQPELFQHSPRVVKRVVAWGSHTEPVALDHAAVVVSEEELLKELRVDSSCQAPELPPDWTIAAALPLPAETVEQRFGTRYASATPVQLKAASEASACWMESLDEGWLFLISSVPGSGWMLSVGAETQVLLAKSRLVAMQIASVGPESGRFPTVPRIVSPLCGPGWLACGSAAMTFDPICGDGTAYAIREAILAAAVIRAIEDGGDAPSLLAHYDARLTAGFRKHLELCLGFYRTGGSGDWWRNEALALRDGMDSCAQKLGAAPAFDYRLRGFELQRV